MLTQNCEAPSGVAIFDGFCRSESKQDTHLARRVSAQDTKIARRRAYDLTFFGYDHLVSKSMPKDAKMHRRRAIRFDSRSAIPGIEINAIVAGFYIDDKLAARVGLPKRAMK